MNDQIKAGTSQTEQSQQLAEPTWGRAVGLAFGWTIGGVVMVAIVAGTNIAVGGSLRKVNTTPVAVPGTPAQRLSPIGQNPKRAILREVRCGSSPPINTQGI